MTIWRYNEYTKWKYSKFMHNDILKSIDKYVKIKFNSNDQHEIKQIARFRYPMVT